MTEDEQDELESRRYDRDNTTAMLDDWRDQKERARIKLEQAERAIAFLEIKLEQIKRDITELEQKGDEDDQDE